MFIRIEFDTSNPKWKDTLGEFLSSPNGTCLPYGRPCTPYPMTNEAVFIWYLPDKYDEHVPYFKKFTGVKSVDKLPVPKKYEEFSIGLDKVLRPYVDWTPPKYDSIVTSVIEKFQKRAEVGQKKYGTNLDRTDLSVLDWIQHTQEEHMNAILYLEKLKTELKPSDPPESLTS